MNNQDYHFINSTTSNKVSEKNDRPKSRMNTSNFRGSHVCTSSLRCSSGCEDCHHGHHVPSLKSETIPGRERTRLASRSARRRRSCSRHHDRQVPCGTDTLDDHLDDDYQCFASCDSSSEDERQYYYSDRRDQSHHSHSNQKRSGRQKVFGKPDKYSPHSHNKLERSGSQVSLAYSAPSHRSCSSTRGICSCCSDVSAFQQCSRSNEQWSHRDTSASRLSPSECPGSHGRHAPCSGCHHGSPKHGFDLTAQLKALLQPDGSHTSVRTSSHQLMMAALQDSHMPCCVQQNTTSCDYDHQQCCSHSSHSFHQQSQNHCYECATKYGTHTTHKYSLPQYQDPSILATSGFRPLPHRPSCNNTQDFVPQTPLRTCENLPMACNSSPVYMRSTVNHSLGHNITSEITALFDQSFQHTSTPDAGTAITACQTQPSNSVHNNSSSVFCHCQSCNTGVPASPFHSHARQIRIPPASCLSTEGTCHLPQIFPTEENGASDTTATVDKPPIGVFWDIENCSVPRGRSALVLVQRIRDQFFGGHREAEFMCVCDINKESNSVIQELNDAQVTVAHINATAKNAADDKLKQSLRRFADTHNPPATVVLISGDVNFANDLSDLRHRNGLKIILVHRQDSSDALTTCANETVQYSDLLIDLPFRSPMKDCSENPQLVVRNLPQVSDISKVRNRLKQLSDNCGGKVVFINENLAVLKFQNAENAGRAKKRLDGEDVFGSKVSVTVNTKPYRASPMRSSGNSSNNSFRSSKGSPKVQSREDENEYVTNDMDTKAESGNSNKSKQILPKVQRVVDNVRFPQSSISPIQSSIETPMCSNSTSSSHLPSSFAQFSASFSPINAPNTTQELPQKNKDHIKEQPFQSCQSAFWEHKPAKSTSKETDLKNILPIRNSSSEQSQKPSELHTLSGLSLIAPSTALRTSGTKTIDAGTQSSAEVISDHLETSLPMSSVPGASYAVVERENLMIGTYIAPSSKSDSLSGYDREFAEEHAPGAEVLVTNLDPMLSKKELRRQLIAAFTDNCIRMENLSLHAPSQGHIQAVVKVNCVSDGQLALAKIGGRKIGTRRVQLAVVPRSQSGSDHLRLMVTPMLQEMPGKCLPFYKFKEVFESRYNQQLFEEDLYQISDTVLVKDSGSTKLVCLTIQHHRSTPNSFLTSSSSGYRQSPWTIPYEPPKELSIPPCEPFCNQHDDIGVVVKNYQMRAAETDQNVAVSLRIFSSQVETLLQLHHGRIPLISFTRCYAAEFEKLEENPEGGVPLEHLLTCVPGVRVAVNSNGVKVICFSGKGKIIMGDDLGRSTSPILPTLLFQFSKEATEVLKHSSYCRLELNLFLQAYNHHFGKHCHLIDYGYTKLVDIFSTIPHIIQMLGAGDKQILTLTHQVQIKRFAQDVTKVLRSQASKQVTVEDLPAAFQRCLSRPFNLVEYGVCEIQDILVDIPNTVIMVDGVGDDLTLSIPHRASALNQLMQLYRREQGYHLQPTDYQCRSVEEVFQKMPHVVEINTRETEKSVVLVNRKHLSQLAQWVLVILVDQPEGRLLLKHVPDVFRQRYQTDLKHVEYGYSQLVLLLSDIPHVVNVYKKWLPECYIELTLGYQFARKARLILLKNQNCIALQDFADLYEKYFQEAFIPSNFEKDTIAALVAAVPRVLTLIGRGQRRAVVLNADLKVVRSITPSSSEDRETSFSPHQESDGSVKTASIETCQESGFVSCSGSNVGDDPTSMIKEDTSGSSVNDASIINGHSGTKSRAASSSDSRSGQNQVPVQISSDAKGSAQGEAAIPGSFSESAILFDKNSQSFGFTHAAASASSRTESSDLDLIDFSSPSVKQDLSCDNKQSEKCTSQSLPSTPSRLRSRCKIAANFSLSHM
ncbi:meiosis regulator and mRNA stability factor 1-like [Anneissia japonica]|uniref:meiosis regulator and mRNA stability factor 1-like n=1 Tax=Anneissia japonica TaxID=1529436 RepID=UPI001425A47F|nr:meiosis regulator and mRNA stability factor 1-like [Anneissia japonica]